MATEVATLQFKADTSDLSKASARLKDVKRSADGAEAANDDYARSNRRVSTETRNNSVEQTKYSAALNKVKSAAKSNAAAIGAMAASLATVGASMKTISVAREFDKINASLVTMTGSQDAADKAFARIQNFAATTPFDLAQVATAFTKLTALGLNPSEEALESYGNTAASFGEDLSQMVEAVADATTGEFERLKAFGITARSELDKVTFTFKGLPTTIGKNAAEIEEYLMRIGLVDFAGATTERANTLDGAISNLGDSFDSLFLSIAQAGAGSVFEDLARSSTEFLNNLGVMIRLSSGTASATEQLAAAEEELALLEAKKAGTSALVFRGLQDRYDAQTQLVEALRLQVQLEGELEAKEKEREATMRSLKEIDTGYLEVLKKKGEQYAQEGEQASEAADRNIEASEREAQARKESAQQQLQDMLLLNETSLEQTFRVEQERLALIQDLRAQDLINEEEYQRAKTEIEANAMAERMELLNVNLASRSEAIRLSQENDRLMGELLDEEKAERAEFLNQRLLDAEDLLLKGKTEKQKAGFMIAKNLMNAEKRENASKIISKTYTAAMDAYGAMAGIPVIGPALGAAAFAAVMATGLQAATQSMAGRALGGQVRAGESYVVGERGPEVLTMGSGGSITPNEALKSGGGQMVSKTANVSFTIQANDTTGFDQLLSSRRGQIISMINQAMNDQGKQALI
jgi:hypothetical protein